MGSDIAFPAIEVSQPIGAFYVGVMSAQDVLTISYADIRRIEERDVEKVIGIQRPLSDERVKELKQYVQTVDAAFPTSIILAVEGKDAEYDPGTATMKIKRSEKVAKIIDGQHRIAGLEGFGGGFDLNVTIFVDMDLEDQALLFATINLKQTRVSKSLAYDLFEYASGRSPQKTCHNIAKLLNSREGSPFQGKIKILGRATGAPAETLTQAAFVDRLLPYVTDDAMRDRDLMKRRKRLERADGFPSEQYIFRNMFVDGRDAEIARVVWNYFAAVAERWPEAWWERRPGSILNRTNGFGGLIRFLGDAYNSLEGKGRVVSQSNFAAIFKRIRLRESDFTPDNYKPGTSGEARLYHDLLEQSGLADAGR